MFPCKYNSQLSSAEMLNGEFSVAKRTARGDAMRRNGWHIDSKRCWRLRASRIASRALSAPSLEHKYAGTYAMQPHINTQIAQTPAEPEPAQSSRQFPICGTNIESSRSHTDTQTRAHTHIIPAAPETCADRRRLQQLHCPSAHCAYRCTPNRAQVFIDAPRLATQLRLPTASTKPAHRTKPNGPMALDIGTGLAIIRVRMLTFGRLRPFYFTFSIVPTR